MCEVGLMVAPTFRILPATPGAEGAWIVETTHGSGIVERSIEFASRKKAEAAADQWTYLDEDWAAI
jgi:hypothetical protein